MQASDGSVLSGKNRFDLSVVQLAVRQELGIRMFCCGGGRWSLFCGQCRAAQGTKQYTAQRKGCQFFLHVVSLLLNCNVRRAVRLLM